MYLSNPLVRQRENPGLIAFLGTSHDEELKVRSSSLCRFSVGLNMVLLSSTPVSAFALPAIYPASIALLPFGDVSAQNSAAHFFRRMG